MNITGYSIEKKLGQGGMATVYLAKQIYMDKLVALKIMSPSLAADPSFGERFLREGKIIAKLSHPSIVSVFDVGVENHLHYIAMEYYPEGELKDKIALGINTERSLAIIKQVAAALQYAHDEGYIHRDVKPENILFDADGNAVLSDFGIARGTNSATQMTQVGSVVGTPHYMSPEQAKGEEVDSRADLYSLGIVLYEMITGEVPFDADSGLAIGIKHITDTPPDLEKKYSALQPIMDRLLAKEPEDRYQSGTELIKDIEHIENGGGLRRPVTDTVVRPSSGINTPLPSSVKKGIDKSGGSGGKALKMVMVLMFALISLSVVGALYLNSRGYIDLSSIIGAGSTKADPTTYTGSGSTGSGSTGAGSTDSRTTAGVKINKLLIEAEEAIDKEWYTAPPGKSARDKFKAILLLDAENIEAKQGLAGINRYYISKAKNYVLSNNFIRAEESLASVDTDYSDYASTEEMIKKAKRDYDQARTSSSDRKAQEERKREINNLFREAEVALANRQYTTPKGKSALDKYKDVLDLDPQNDRAKTGIKSIGEKYLAMAESSLRRKRWDEAFSFVDNAELVIPLDTRVVDLRDKIEQQKRKAETTPVRDPAAEKRAKIAALLQKADRYYFEDKMATPRDGNAQDTYLEVLRLDSRNSRAKKGLNDITTYFANLAETAIQLENFKEAEKNIGYIKYGKTKAADLRVKLATAKREYEEKIAENRKQQEIKGLKSEAKRFFDDGNYSKAVIRYQKVLSLLPRDFDAKMGLDNSIKKLEALAKDAADDGDFDKAENYADGIPSSNSQYDTVIAYIKKKKSEEESSSSRRPRRPTGGGGF